MTVNNAWYPKQLPTKIAIELTDGSHHLANLTPFRAITREDLQPLAVWIPAMGDEIPDYTLKLYRLARANDPKLKQLRINVGLSKSSATSCGKEEVLKEA